TAVRLSPAACRWSASRPHYLVPVEVLSARLRGRMLSMLLDAHAGGRLKFFGNYEHLADSNAFRAYLGPLWTTDWFVYAKRPFAGSYVPARFLLASAHHTVPSNSCRGSPLPHSPPATIGKIARLPGLALHGRSQTNPHSARGQTWVTSRGFVHWRLSNAGPPAGCGLRAQSAGPRPKPLTDSDSCTATSSVIGLLAPTVSAQRSRAHRREPDRPARPRSTGQGFCYNAGRAAGSLFPTMVGYLSQGQSLGISIAICSATAFGLMIVMLLLLRETHGRSLATFGDRGGRLLIVVACLIPELTISATADLALSFLNVVPATFREWRRPTG